MLVVEGQGDVAAFPHLVGKIGAWLGMPLFVTKPIRCGGWGSIRKPGGLERWTTLAASREDCTRVVFVVDLDDGCPVEERAIILERVAALEALHGIEILIAFCIREYESWLLYSLDKISENDASLSDLDTSCCHMNNSAIRDAKGKLRALLPDGYSESSDQHLLTKMIDIKSLYERCRSFKKFVKCVSSLDYDTLEAAL